MSDINEPLEQANVVEPVESTEPMAAPAPAQPMDDQLAQPTDTQNDGQSGYVDFLNQSIAFAKAGWHRQDLKRIAKNPEIIPDVVAAYNGPAILDSAKNAISVDVFNYMYANRLAEIDKIERANFDFNMGANFMAMTSKVTPENYEELNTYLKKNGVMFSKLDKNTAERLIKGMLYEQYSKNLKGRPLPDRFYHDDRFLKLTPEAQYSLVNLDSINRILGGQWKKSDDLSTVKGYESHVEKFNLREQIKRGEISDIDAILELNRLDYTYGEEGFINNVFSGFGAFGGEIATGFGVANDTVNEALAYQNKLQSEVEQISKEEPSVFSWMLKTAVEHDINENRRSFNNLAMLAYGQGESEARVNQLDNIRVIKHKNPSVSLPYLLDLTEQAKNKRALMFTAVNFLSFIPIPMGGVLGKGAAAIGKGANVIGSGAMVRLAKTMPKVKYLQDIIPAAIAKRAAAYADKRVVTEATKTVAKVGAGVATKEQLAAAALGNMAVNTVIESAEQAAVEGISAVDYTQISNDVLNENESKFKAFFKAASESFVDNLLVSSVLGAPSAVANLGVVARKIADDAAKITSFKAQEHAIEQAVKEGATSDQIKGANFEHPEVKFDIDKFKTDIEANPLAIKELNEVLDDPNHPSHALAERIIVGLNRASNHEIDKKFNKQSSAEAFIIDPVDLAMLYKDRPELEKVVKRHRRVTDLTEEEALAQYSREVESLVDVLATDSMFTKDQATHVTQYDRKLNTAADQIEADLNAKLALPEGAGKEFTNSESRNVARFFAPMITNYILRFCEVANLDPLKVYNELNIKFVASKRVYDLSDGSSVAEGGIDIKEGETRIYLGDKAMHETLVHELAHLHLDMLRKSPASVHKLKLDSLLKAYCEQKQIAPVDSADKLSPAQWQELQELYAYNTVFNLGRQYLDVTAKADRFLDLVALSSKTRELRKAREEKINNGETLETDGSELKYENMSELTSEEVALLNSGYFDIDTKEELKERAPKFDRLDETGALKSDADLVTMMGAGLLRHLGDCGSYSEFEAKFKQAYKESYGTEFVMFNYELMNEFKFLNEVERGSYTSKQLTDDILNPESPNFELIAKVLGPEFAQHYAEISTNLRSSLLNKALSIYRLNKRRTLNEYEERAAAEAINAKAFDPEYLTTSDELRQVRINRIVNHRKQYAVEGELREANLVLRDLNENRLTMDSPELKAVLGKAGDSLDVVNNVAGAQRVLTNYVTKLTAQLNNLKDSIGNDTAKVKELKSRLTKIEARLVDEANILAKAKYLYEADVVKDKELAIKRLNDIDSKEAKGMTVKERTEVTSYADYIVNRVLAIREHLNNLKTNNVVFSKEDLQANGFSEVDIAQLEKLGLAQEIGNLSFTDFAMRTDSKDIDQSTYSPAERLHDIINYTTNEGTYIDTLARDLRDPEFNDNIINITKLREEFDNNGIDQMLQIAGKLSKELITKFRSQVNRVTEISQIKNEATNIVHSLSIKATPYQLIRKGESYLRKALNEIAHADFATSGERINRAVNHLVQSETLFIAANEMRKMKKDIDSKKSKIKRIVSKTAKNKDISNSYDNDTFMSAKALAYQMGIAQSKRVYEDIVAFREGKVALGQTDSQIFYKQFGDRADVLDVITDTEKGTVKNFANMSYAEAMQSLNTIDNTLELSRKLHNVRNIQRTQKIQSIVATFKQKIGEYREDNNIKESETKDVSDLENKKGLRNSLKSFRAHISNSTMRPSTIIAMLDGEIHPEKSQLFNAIYEPILTAEQKLNTVLSSLAKQHVKPTLAKVNELGARVKLSEPYRIEGVKFDGKGDPQKVVYEFGKSGNIVNEAAVLIANMGTESNRQAMCRSLGITEKQLLEHIDNLTKLGVITDELWDMVDKHIWRAYDGIYNHTIDTFNKVYNTMYSRENGVTIRLASGRVLHGGYCPLTIAKDLDHVEITNPLDGDSYAQANLPSKDSFTKDRVAHSHDMSFDLSDVFYNMKRQETFAHMAEPCVTTYHILNNDGIKGELENILPDSMQVLNNGLANAMSQSYNDINRGMGQIMTKMAAASNTAMLAYNLTNALMGFAQIFTALREVNMRYLVHGVWDFVTQRMGSGPLSRANIDSASVFMTNRNYFKNTSIDREISKFNKGKAGAALSKLGDHAFLLQSVVQNMCDQIVWNAAYHKQLDINASKLKSGKLVNGLDDSCVRYADSVVRRTQLSKHNSDLSLYETKERFYSTFLTPFASVFISMANLSRTYNAMIDRRYSNKNALSKMIRKGSVLLSVWIAPVVVGEIIRGFANGDDEEGMTSNIATNAMATIGYKIHPVAGSIAQLMAKTIMNTLFDGKEYIPAGIYSSPLESFVEKSIKNTIKLFGDKSEDVNVLDAIAVLGLVIPGLPQISNNIKYLQAYLNDDLRDTTTADFVRGLVTGKASKEQKGE